MRWTAAIAAATIAAGATQAWGADSPIKFWNLTAETITEFYLAPAGTKHWGGNQCVNDKDGAVDTDEMLPVPGVKPGRYDAKLKDRSGRICLVKGVHVKAHGVFSISEKQLTSCVK
jgi:hypothetical protein